MNQFGSIGRHLVDPSLSSNPDPNSPTKSSNLSTSTCKQKLKPGTSSDLFNLGAPCLGALLLNLCVGVLFLIRVRLVHMRVPFLKIPNRGRSSTSREWAKLRFKAEQAKSRVWGLWV